MPVARLWDAYADPRQLERFWGPVGWPATFTRHDMAVGGESHYNMTGPDGTTSRGWFRFLAIEPNARFEVQDGFADEFGLPSTEMPTMHMAFTFAPTENGSRCSTVTTFASVESMQQLVSMGMMDGMRSSMSQIDAVLTDLRSYAGVRRRQDRRRGLSLRMGAHRWHAAFRLRRRAPRTSGAVSCRTSERMIDTPGPSTRNEMTIVATQGGTLLSLVITYPDKAMRDMILGTGMTTGMETSYARLEREVLSA